MLILGQVFPASFFTFYNGGIEYMQPIIKAVDLSYTYMDLKGQELLALDKINLTINPGEFVAIIGTNGSGKSTLAKHFNALLQPSGGHCYIAGLDSLLPDNIWDIRQKVGMVFQNPDNQIVAAIVEEDIAFGPENLGIPPAEIQERVSKALELVGMEEYRLHAPHLLSGGQKQRIAIAGVLAIKPTCLVLDEPTAMLDPKSRQEVMKTVLALNKQEGITIVHITHFMQEAILADRVVVMGDGKIHKMGTPKEVFQDVESITQLGLEVPVASEVAYLLRKQGIKIGKDIITDEELIGELCLLK